MLTASSQQEEEDNNDPNAKEQTVTQNGKCSTGQVPQSNGNGLSDNTVISRDTLKLLPDGEPVSNGKIKVNSTGETNEDKNSVQVWTGHELHFILACNIQHSPLHSLSIFKTKKVLSARYVNSH